MPKLCYKIYQLTFIHIKLINIYKAHYYRSKKLLDYNQFN